MGRKTDKRRRRAGPAPSDLDTRKPIDGWKTSAPDFRSPDGHGRRVGREWRRRTPRPAREASIGDQVCRLYARRQRCGVRVTVGGQVLSSTPGRGHRASGRPKAKSGCGTTAKGLAGSYYKCGNAGDADPPCGPGRGTSFSFRNLRPTRGRRDHRPI